MPPRRWLKCCLALCFAGLGGCGSGDGYDLEHDAAGRNQGGSAGSALPAGATGGGAKASGGTTSAGGSAGSVASAGSGGRAQAGGGGSLGGGGGSASGGGTAGSAGATPAGPPTLVTFSPPAGGFDEQMTVSLAANDPNAEVHYTLDGSIPNADSPLYQGAIAIDRSTRVLAVALLPGGGQPDPLPVYGATYLRIADDALDFASHLPLVVVHTFDSGRLEPQGREHVPATISIFEPVAGSSSLTARASVDSAIGIHVRGQTSRAYPKLQYAVELRDDTDGGDRPLAVLGMPSESDWVLSDSVNFDRALFRNALAFAISNRIGRYASRTRFAEAFLVDDGGDVTRSKYIGFYTVVEKIKRDDQRVDVTKLDQADVQAPAVSGGYILSIDKGDTHFNAGGQRFQFVYPEPEAMDDEQRLPQIDFIREYINDFSEAVTAPDFIGPSHGRPYSDFIDVGAFIDHNVVNALAKNADGLRISTYFNKDRERPLAAGPVWDFDRAFGTLEDSRASEPEGWTHEDSDATHYLQQGFWGQLFADPAFKAQYKERFLALLDNELSAANLDAIIDGFVTQIGDAQARNFERWGDFHPRESYANEVSIVKEFLRRRVDWIGNDLRTWP